MIDKISKSLNGIFIISKMKWWRNMEVEDLENYNASSDKNKTFN